MSSIKHPQPRFSGYGITQGKADLYLPGHAGLKNGQVKAEVMYPGQTTPQLLDMKRDGDYWVTVNKEQVPLGVPLGTDYRIRLNDHADIEANVSLKGHTSVTPLKMTKHAKHGTWTLKPPDTLVGSDMTCAIPINRSDLGQNPQLRVEKLEPGQKPTFIAMEKDETGLNWAFTDHVTNASTTYRLSPALDLLEAVPHGDYGSFNRISPNSLKGPQKSRVIIDVFMDSLLPQNRLPKLEEETRALKKGVAVDEKAPLTPDYPHVPVYPKRNHFQQIGALPINKQQAGLDEMLGTFERTGITSVLMKPPIGGDNMSSHRYWTKDPFVLNSTFTNKTGFRNTAKSALLHGIALTADGAFVNQGLDGVQITSNLVHGFASPYWRWLKYGDERMAGGPPPFPGMAFKKYTFGVLPSQLNSTTKLPEVAYDHIAIRIINNPEDRAGRYDDKRPTFIQLYDPRLEDEKGNPIKTKPNSDIKWPPMMQGTSDSVQKYPLPVDAKQLQEKLKQFGSPNQSAATKKEFLEWERFRLDQSNGDDSGVKWDGQVNTAMLNTRNEQVVDYLKGAVGYWSRLVMNTHIENVTQAMSKAQAQAGRQLAELPPKPPQETPEEPSKAALRDKLTKLKDGDLHLLLQAVTQGEETPLTQVDKILPKIHYPEGNLDAAARQRIFDEQSLSAAELEKISNQTGPDHAVKESGKSFAKRLLEEVPMNVLPLPTLFKATLCYPGLAEALNPSKAQGAMGSFMNRVILGNLARLPLVGGVFKFIRNLFFPLPFQKALGAKMDGIFSQLNAETQEKLRFNNMQSLLADRVGEVIYLSLLTDLQPDAVRKKMDSSDPKELEDAFYKGMPKDILLADPHTASKLLPHLLNQRLKNLHSLQLGKLVEAELKDLEPRKAAVANAVLQHREGGLNWRIDAARDVGDMNRVFSAPEHERAQVMEEEFNYVQKFWDKVTSAMRAPFPKTSIIAELTDLNLLAGDKNKPLAEQVLKKLMNTFSGTPNMSYMFSPLMEVTHHASRPDEHGNTSIGPAKFFENVRNMSEAVPFPALRQFQNMSASHDFPTSSHVMLTNPDLFNMDLLKWWGLKDSLNVAADELQSKACFKDVRDGLNIPDDQLKSALHRLRTLATAPETKKRMPEDLKAFYDKAAKESSPSTNRPTPDELKAKFIPEIFSTLEPKALALDTPEQMKALEKALKDRIIEPSQAKAMRGTIVNAALKLSKADLSDDMRRDLWKALDKAIEKSGRDFGYQQLDMALNDVFDQTDLSKYPAKQLETLKLKLYNQATDPVLGKLKRLFAIQNALPGNPSVYLPDLFAQGGSEWTKNVYVQNRNIIRTDKLQSIADKEKGKKQDNFNQYFDEVGSIFRSRSNPELQALNDGVVLPVTPDEKSGILPIVRDNGKQQVITLVDTGIPEPLSDSSRAGLGADYAMPKRKSGIENYQPNLSELGMSEDKDEQGKSKKIYKDVNNNARFELTNGRLHPFGHPKQGVEVPDWRMLVREDRTKKA